MAGHTPGTPIVLAFRRDLAKAKSLSEDTECSLNEDGCYSPRSGKHRPTGTPQRNNDANDSFDERLESDLDSGYRGMAFGCGDALLATRERRVIRTGIALLNAADGCLGSRCHLGSCPSRLASHPRENSEKPYLAFSGHSSNTRSLVHQRKGTGPIQPRHARMFVDLGRTPFSELLGLARSVPVKTLRLAGRTSRRIKGSIKKNLEDCFTRPTR